MRTYNLDLTPLFRSTVGFDRMGRLLDTVSNTEAPTYPPYNIEKLADDAYRVTMAVAGFNAADLDITQNNNTLIVKGDQDKAEGENQFLHRGIATRAFERQFELADHVNVVNSNLENGMLAIELQREIPEELKPRKIAIGSGAKAQTIEHEKKAA
ncbi:MAG: Hsp20 family protein [Alphaproteobacteria bacterium]|jgi:molecular chaperone IbpA|nr:Hsp20 family protein [Alphaproteobacteria bacterium]